MSVGVYTCRKLYKFNFYYMGLHSSEGVTLREKDPELQLCSILGPYTLQLQLLFTFYHFFFKL